MPIQQITAAEAANQRGAEGTLYQDAANSTVLYAKGPNGNLSQNMIGAALRSEMLQRPYLLMTTCGDSISTRDQPQTASGLNGPRADGIGYLMQVLSMGRLRLHTCRATAGFTTQQIADTHVSQVLADNPDVVTVLTAANDTYTTLTAPDASDTYAKARDKIIAPLLAAGKLVQQNTLSRGASRTSTIPASSHAAANGFNDLIRSADGSHNKLLTADLATVSANTTGATEGVDTSQYVTTEEWYLHPNDTGSMFWARERWRSFQAAGALPRPSEVIDANNTASAGSNPRGAGSNADTILGTAIGTGITGTGPDCWTINRSGTSTAVVTPGAVARVDGRPGQLVQIAATIGSAGNAVQVFPAAGAAVFLGASGLRGNGATYVRGQVKHFTDGNTYRVITGGTTAGSQPASLPALGGIVADNTVVWMRIRNITPGAWVRQVTELYVSAHSVDKVWFQSNLKQYAAGYVDLANGVVFEMDNGTQYQAGGGSGNQDVVTGPSVTGHNGYAVGALPLNQWLRYETPWVKIAADTNIVEPMFRVLGAASAQCTMQIGYCDMQVRG